MHHRNNYYEDQDSSDSNGYNYEYQNDNDSSDNDGNGYNDYCESNYDNEGGSDNQYESSDDDNDKGNKGYKCSIHQEQFDEVLEGYLKFIRSDKHKVLSEGMRIRQVEKQMSRVYTRRSVLISLDFEAWEQNQEYITEIGIAIYDPRFQEFSLMPNIKTFHIIIDEHKQYTNGKFVPNNQHKFQGGPSWYLSKKSAKSFLLQVFYHYFSPDFDLHCSLVGHDLKGDIKYLERLGIIVPNNVRRLDTQTLYSYTHGNKGASLRKALQSVNQPMAFLHNAGNDAYYTIILALKLCDPHVRYLTGIDDIQSDSEVDNSVDGLLRHLIA